MPAQTVSLQATHQQMVEDQFVCAQGNVRVSFQDIRLQCDVIEFDQKTMKVKASGNVVLDQAGTRMACDRLEFDLAQKTGTLYQVDAFLPPTYSFRGAELEKLDETHYRFRDGTLHQLLAHRRLASVEHRDLRRDDGAGRLWALPGRLPARPGRAGLLHPATAVARQARPGDRPAGPQHRLQQQAGRLPGQRLLLADLAISRHHRSILDLYSKGWVGIGDEVRWAPTESSRGQILLYTLKDPDGRWEWKAFGRHNQLFAGGYSLKAELQEISDIDFFQQFERTFDRNTLRTLYSHLTMTRNWGSQSLNLRTDHRRTFFSTIGPREPRPRSPSTVCPSWSTGLRSTRVGTTPLYVSLVALADQLRVDRLGHAVRSLRALRPVSNRLAPHLGLPMAQHHTDRRRP